MSKLIFYSNTNSHGKKDATGAFIPEAKAFANLHKVPKSDLLGMKLVRTNQETRRNFVIDNILKRRPGIDTIAFFCHGWFSGIQFGFNLKNYETLINAMSKVCTKDVKVIFYACLTAENSIADNNISDIGIGTDGGFADMFRDSMVRKGMVDGWVDGHKTAGHTTWNPYLVRFDCKAVEKPQEGAEGGDWIIAPKSKLWSKWVKKLKQNQDFRLSFSFMEKEEIEIFLTENK